MSERKNIDLLVYELESGRQEILDGIAHLTKEQFFTPPVPGEYPIGAHLMHYCECDIAWTERISEGSVKISDDLRKRSFYNAWFDPGGDDAGVPPTEAPEKQFYFDTLAEVRKHFVDYVKSMTDEDLDKEITRVSNGKEVKISKRWIICNHIKHDAHHRGQIFMLLRMAGWSKVS
ncbi:MAG TPA: DinB family protein [Ignavibacteria bacterium]|nr:DinB family protein [Ignavibacteria bacterium]